MSRCSECGVPLRDGSHTRTHWQDEHAEKWARRL